MRRMRQDIVGVVHGIAVGYWDGAMHYRRAAADNTVPNVVPAGEAYRQLKP